MLAPSILSVNEMGMVIAMVVIGGMGHRYGALVGVAVIRTLEHFVRGFGAQYTLVIITGVALLVVLFFREGITTAFTRKIDRAVQRKRWADSEAG